MLSARLAKPDDLAFITKVTDAAYRDYVPITGAKPLPMTQDYNPHIAAGGVWVVERDGEDVGVVDLQWEADHVLIFSLAVQPTAQGGGVGRWMLAFVEAQARRAGVAEVRLYTNPLMGRNIRIYGEAGYQETGRRANPYRPGSMVVDMAKQLHEPTLQREA